MAKLSDIVKSARVRGIAGEQAVTIVAMEWHGDTILTVTYKTDDGALGDTMVYDFDADRLEVENARPWSFDVDANDVRFVSEAYRIGLAHLFDPYLAVRTSSIEPLPHQISAVYQEMLPKLPLRYVLADDPGAGKTIMTGLLIKEMIARGDLKRCLIVAPGNLVEQWQDELYRKFGLSFRILTNDVLEASASGNVFDRLYEDWATLERFQRTRGVLRLMASVIHELWMNQDPSPMIMPGSFPLDMPNVRDELTRYLDDNWNGVVDSEIDGKQSLPYRNDSENPRYGANLASRRVARAIMLGSAPDVNGQTASGIERAHIRLGTVQPGENISVFNDALSTFQFRSSFLYSDAAGNRYWYDTRPTLRKVEEDRAQQYKDSDAIYEIETRLKKQRNAEPFSGRHICPASSLDVPDEDSLRIVVLPPAQSHRGNTKDSLALKMADEILGQRGTAPRTYKNMVVFAAADASYVSQLIAEAKRFLAWTSIREDHESLNLDVVQTRETEQNVRRSDESLDVKIDEAYSWLLTPAIDLAAGSMGLRWDVEHVSGSGEGIIAKMGKRLLTTQAAIKQWALALLKMELDRLLWRDKNHIQIKQLWNYLCSYCYLPRLAVYGVLEDAISRGFATEEYFGIAAGYSDGRYLELTLGEGRLNINQSDLLVKPGIARAQITAEQEAASISAAAMPREDILSHVDIADTGTSHEESPYQNKPARDESQESVSSTPKPDKTIFMMTAKLDNTRVNRNIQNILEEIVGQLQLIDDVDVELTLNVKAKATGGIPVSIIRAVSENCSTLGIGDFRFD